MLPVQKYPGPVELQTEDIEVVAEYCTVLAGHTVIREYARYHFRTSVNRWNEGFQAEVKEVVSAIHVELQRYAPKGVKVKTTHKVL